MATEMIFTWLRFLNEYLMKPSWFLFVAFYYPQELHLIDSILWNALLIFLLDGFILCLQFLFDHKIVTWKADLGFKKCNALNLCQTYFMHSQWKFIAIEQWGGQKQQKCVNQDIRLYLGLWKPAIIRLARNLLILHHGYSYMQVT